MGRSPRIGTKIAWAVALLADCSAYSIAIVQDLRDSEAAKVFSTTEQPRDQNDDQNNSEYFADDITTSAGCSRHCHNIRSHRPSRSAILRGSGVSQGGGVHFAGVGPNVDEATKDIPRQAVRTDSVAEEDGFEPSVPLGREVLERSNISTRWVLFLGLRVRIRFPSGVSPNELALGTGDDGYRLRVSLT